MVKVEKTNVLVNLGDVDGGQFFLWKGRVCRRIDMALDTDGTTSIISYLDGYNGWDYVERFQDSQVELLKNATVTFTTDTKAAVSR